MIINTSHGHASCPGNWKRGYHRDTMLSLRHLGIPIFKGPFTRAYGCFVSLEQHKAVLVEYKNITQYFKLQLYCKKIEFQILIAEPLSIVFHRDKVVCVIFQEV